MPIVGALNAIFPKKKKLAGASARKKRNLTKNVSRGRKPPRQMPLSGEKKEQQNKKESQKKKKKGTKKMTRNSASVWSGRSRTIRKKTGKRE